MNSFAVNSFAEKAVKADPYAGEQTGNRMTGRSGLDSVLVFGLRLSVAHRDVAETVLGVLNAEKYPMLVYREKWVPRVTKNCATLLDLFEWKPQGYWGAPEVTANLRESALPFSEQCASERGFRRYGSHITFERPRASSFSSDYSSAASDFPRDLFSAAQ